VFVLCYCISLHHFNAFVENFTSYVILYLYVCWCHGLRLPDLNKETTYLLTYLLAQDYWRADNKHQETLTRFSEHTAWISLPCDGGIRSFPLPRMLLRKHFLFPCIVDPCGPCSSLCCNDATPRAAVTNSL